MDEKLHKVREELKKHLKEHDNVTTSFYERLLYYIERLIHNEVRAQFKNRDDGICKDE
jgi:hypothetical protein